MKTLTTLGALVVMLAIAASARADGKDFAAACRESGDQIACTLAGVPL